MNDNAQKESQRDRGIAPVSQQRKNDRRVMSERTRKQDGRKKLIKIEKKRQTVPIFEKDTGMSRGNIAFGCNYICSIWWTGRYNDLFDRRKIFCRRGNV